MSTYLIKNKKASGVFRYMDMCRAFRGIDVNFLQFLDASLTKVTFPSLSIIEVSAVIQNETDGVKHIVKPLAAKKVFNPKKKCILSGYIATTTENAPGRRFMSAFSCLCKL
jgi:hypothetical protein